MELFAATRSSVQSDHALITPDTHVATPLAGWERTAGVIHISPQLGAGFTQYTALLQAAARSGLPPQGVERFVYVRSGSVTVTVDQPQALESGGYAYLPPDVAHEIRAEQPATLILFEKPYAPAPRFEAPVAIIGREQDVDGQPFQGDPDARLQTLLPDRPKFDLAVNLFTFQPGATLPQVEIHVMEHGLILLDGAGIYRLGERWYPVTAGDVIWMRAYCPQWFVAMGKQPARYLYYKNVNRDAWGNA